MTLGDVITGADRGANLRYYYDLERHFEASGKPSATAMMIMKKMANGEPLGPPGKPGKGSLLERQQQEAEEKEKGKDGRSALGLRLKGRWV